MTSKIECHGCGTLIGHHYSFPWTFFGQDPPENDLFNPDEVAYDKAENIFCTQDCHDQYHQLGKYEEKEAEA